MAICEAFAILMAINLLLVIIPTDPECNLVVLNLYVSKSINLVSILLPIDPDCNLVELNIYVRKYTYIYYKKREADFLFRNLYESHLHASLP